MPLGLDLSRARSSGALAELGRRTGGVVFPGAIGAALDELVAGLGTGEVADLRVVACPGVAALPFEAALLPSGRAPALLPAVRMWRALQDVRASPPPPAPGPVKILVAVGAPDNGQTPRAPLGSKREMGGVLDAVSGAGRAGSGAHP